MQEDFERNLADDRNYNFNDESKEDLSDDFHVAIILLLHVQ
jgi:hypothetical protein